MLHTSNNHGRESRTEHEEDPDEEEHGGAALGHRVGRDGVLLEADGIVPAEERGHRHERVPRELYDDAGQHERLPRVGLGRALAHLIQRSLRDKVRHHLLHQVGEEDQEHEDGHHLVLQALKRERLLVESKADEQRREHAHGQLGVDVLGAAPVLLERAVLHREVLLPEGDGKLAVAGGGRSNGLLGEFSLHLGELAADLGTLGAVLPHFRPVDFGYKTRSSADDFQHPLSGIRVGGALCSPVVFKVLDQGGHVLAEIPKVDRFSAGREEQQAVELLHQHGGRLVDGAEDGLAVVGKFTHERADGPGGLRVKTRSRFVEEEQQVRFGSDLNADGQTLALFNVETFTEDTDNSISVLLHAQHFDHLIDVCNLLSTRDVSWLPEQSGESQSLTDSADLEVEVLLLHVTGLALKGIIAQAAVDEHLAGDHAHSHTIGQDIEKSGLTSARDTHQRGQRTRLDPAVNLVENTPRLALDLDVVAHVLPVEDGSLLDEGRNLVVLSLHRMLLVVRGFWIIVPLLLHPGRDLAAGKDEHFSFGRLGFDNLDGANVRDEEEGEEGENDSQIPPHVRRLVSVALVEERVAIDEALAGDGALAGADEVVASVVRTGGSWNVRGAVEAAVAELVDHEGLKGVLDRVDVADPLEPRAHVALGDGEAGVDDESEHEDARRNQSLGEGAGHGADSAEDVGHGEGGEDGEEEEDEKVAGGSPQVGHEVEDQVEDDGSDGLGWEVDEHGADGFGGRVIQGILVMLFHDRTLLPEGQNLEGASEAVHKDGEKEKCTAGEEAFRVGRHVVEHGRDDERHDDVAKHRSQCHGHVAFQPGEAAPGAELELLKVGEGVRRGSAYGF